MFQYLESLDEAGQLLQAGGRSTVRLGGYGPLGSGASNALIEDQRLKDVAEWEVARRDSDGKLGLSGGALLAVQVSRRGRSTLLSVADIPHYRPRLVTSSRQSPQHSYSISTSSPSLWTRFPKP